MDGLEDDEVEKLIHDLEGAEIAELDDKGSADLAEGTRKGNLNCGCGEDSGGEAGLEGSF
jgi:hypothetical protein